MSDRIKITLAYDDGNSKTWDFPYERAISSLDPAVEEFIDHCDVDPSEVTFTHRVLGLPTVSEETTS